MTTADSLSLRWRGQTFEFLDQTLLPREEVWIQATNTNQVVQAIRELKIRGAPLIATAALFELSRLEMTGANRETIITSARLLRESRPTAVNLMNEIDLLLKRYEEKSQQPAGFISKWVAGHAERERSLYQKISNAGAELIQNNENVLTHCNTGGLAVFGGGTALGAIREAAKEKKLHVYVDETRPLLQGGRLTSWELQNLQIPYTLICDNMAGFLMGQGRIHKIFVGADRITTHGDVANKIGTYSLAVLAYYHRVPFYVAAPWSTVDLHMASGKDIPIEERTPSEIQGVYMGANSLTWAPEGAPVWNPAFDVTPHQLVSGYILESGVLDLSAFRKACTLKAQEIARG